MTDDGKRKERLVEKFLYRPLESQLDGNFYLGILSILKEYVCVFQESAALVHKLHDKQLGTLKKCLGCI